VDPEVEGQCLQGSSPSLMANVHSMGIVQCRGNRIREFTTAKRSLAPEDGPHTPNARPFLAPHPADGTQLCPRPLPGLEPEKQPGMSAPLGGCCWPPFSGWIGLGRKPYGNIVPSCRILSAAMCLLPFPWFRTSRFKKVQQQVSFCRLLMDRSQFQNYL
jgi:hypothetical protein